MPEDTATGVGVGGLLDPQAETRSSIAPRTGAMLLRLERSILDRLDDHSADVAVGDRVHHVGHPGLTTSNRAIGRHILRPRPEGCAVNRVSVVGLGSRARIPAHGDPVLN